MRGIGERGWRGFLWWLGDKGGWGGEGGWMGGWDGRRYG